MNLESLGEVKTGTDILNAEKKPVEFVVPELGITAGRVNVVCGASFVGKTVFLTHLAICIATGIPILGKYKTKRGKVLILDFEQGWEQTSWAIDRAARGMNLAPEDLGGLVVISEMQRKLDQSPKETEAMLVELLRDFDVCIIDPFLAAHPSADENSSEVREHLDRLSRIGRKAKCAMVLVHHEGKSKRRGMQAGRGHSSMNDAAGAWFRIEKVRDSFVLRCEKNQWRNGIEPIRYQLVDVGGVDPGSGRSVGLRLVLDELSAPDSLEKEIFRELGTASMTTSELAKKIHRRRQDVYDELERMLETGALELDGKLLVVRSRVPMAAE